jgi:hypothetical protein
MPNSLEIRMGHEATLVETADELVAILDVLQGQHDREVLKQLEKDLHLLIRNSKELYKVVSILHFEDQIYLFRILGDNLAKIIGKGSGLRDLLAYISEDETEKVLIETLGPAGIQKLITSAVELAEVLEWVYGSMDLTIVSYLTIDSIQRIVKSGREMSLILNALDPVSQRNLIAQLGTDFIDKLIHQTEDFAYLMRALPFETSRHLVDSMTGDKIKDLIRSTEDLAYLNRYLDESEQEYLKLKLEEMNYAL